MELKLVFVILYLSLFHQQYSQGQQAYLDNACPPNATTQANISEGYLCDGNASLSCKSFVAFRSRGGTHNNASVIAQLFGLESSEIVSIIEIPPLNSDVRPRKLIMVPLSCACPMNYFQHFTTYIVEAGDTYHNIVSNTYMGLTTCKALIGQNPSYEVTSIAVGLTEMIVRLRCACPSGNQTASGVRSLLTYAVGGGDTVGSVAEMFGVSEESVLDANMLSRQSDIFLNTPLLVPLTAESCSVNPRMFFCDCPAGSNRTLDGSLCITVDQKSFPFKLVTLLGVGIGLALLFLFLSSYKLHHFLRKRKERVRKQEFFKQNGGLLLEEKMPSNESTEKPKLFTAEELQRATDNYSQSRFLGQGGFGTVYKGMLPDGNVVAVKKSKAIGENQIEQFINEIVVLSCINHRNVVKLIGFCLETETPLLVYEFVSNGTLSQHIRAAHSPLSWETRLSIACDVAGALAYMHSSASVPIFHRDVKSSNVLLDEKYNAKVSDFGTSRSVPQDKTHLTTAVQGTLGYMDPEYFQSSQFTDKSDVYSFGVTLVELLTGENPYSFSRGDNEGKNLVSTFILLTKENEVFRILDARVAVEADVEDVRVVAELAVRCLRLNGKKRPTMKRVAMELEGFRNRQTVLEMEQESQSFVDEEQYLITAVYSGESSSDSDRAEMDFTGLIRTKTKSRSTQNISQKR